MRPIGSVCQDNNTALHCWWQCLSETPVQKTIVSHPSHNYFKGVREPDRSRDLHETAEWELEWPVEKWQSVGSDKDSKDYGLHNKRALPELFRKQLPIFVECGHELLRLRCWLDLHKREYLCPPGIQLRQVQYSLSYGRQAVFPSWWPDRTRQPRCPV